MKYYLIAGEASGDLHGSNLIKALKQQDPAANFRAWGGDRMEGQGAELVKHYRALAFMGFVEVLLNLRTILSNLRFCKQDIHRWQPDVLVLIDYPGFNMRIARWAKARGIKVVYYIAPQAWAWKQKRALALKRDVDRLLCILPFEKKFFAQYGLKADFVGHPLLDAIDKRPDFDRDFRFRELALQPGRKVIALLPGSRKQEIEAMLPVMLQATQDYDAQCVIAQAPSQEPHFYHKWMKGYSAQLVAGHTYDLLEIADAALVASGTATLETALFKVPEVVCYRGNLLSYWIARQLVRVKYISLVNLIMDRPVVKELIQHELTVPQLRLALGHCLSAAGRESITADYLQLIEKLGGAGASELAAKIIIEEA